MSETTRKVCGERLSNSLQDRDARVIGKSVSKSDYGSISIGSVGSRMEKRLDRAEERYQHTLPRFVSRFFGAPKRSLWSSSYPSVDLNYLLWNPYAEEEVEEVPQAPDVWMKPKKPWVGARVFRMPKSQPFTPMQAVRTPKSVYNRQQIRRPSTLERLRHKNAGMAYQKSVENQALEGLPPFLSSSKTMQKVVGQSKRAHRNRFRPSGIGAQFLPTKIQNEMGVQKQGFQQAKGRFRKNSPTGLRSLQISSPMMQELMPLQVPVQEEQELQETASPWFTREPASSQSSRGSVQRSRTSTVSKKGSPTKESVRNPRSAISSLSRSLRRDVRAEALPSQRAAQNINLGTKQSVAETPASVHALQRSAMQSEQNSRSVLPIASIFSEQSRIGQSIARHQASLIRKKESSIGSQVAAKTQRSLPSAQKRQDSRRMQLFSTPDLLDLQNTSSIAAVESVQEKAESPWFTRQPQHQSKQTKSFERDRKTSIRGEQALRTNEKRTKTSNLVQDKVPPIQREQAESGVQKPSFARRSSRVQDVDIFGFGAEPQPSVDKRVSASTYAMDRMENPDDSSYQSIDQRVQERLERREAANEDRVARIDAPVSHQVRERRFVPTPDFVDIQEPIPVDDVVLEEQTKESPWFTRSPVVHAAQRKENPTSVSRSIIPKAIANTRTEELLKKLESRQLDAQVVQNQTNFKAGHRSRTPVESALQRTPSPSAHNPSRPQIVRNTDDKVSLLRSAGLDKQGVALALAYAQGKNTPQSGFADQIVGKQGWADVRFRRQSPVSYARSARPETVVVQTGEEAEESAENVQEITSPWFTREPATQNTNASGNVSSIQDNLRSTSTQQGRNVSEKSGSLSHMLARSTVSPSLPQEIAVGTKSRSIFSGQPTVRLSTMPSQYGLEQTVLSQPQQVAQEQDVAQQATSQSNSTWLSPKEKSQEQRAANALIKRVAKLGVKAKVYKSPKGTMMDAKAAKALGFEPPKGKNRIPLTWVLEAVENKSNSGILPNWAQRSSEKPLHKGTADMVNSLNKASSMDEVLRVIFERTSSRQVAPSFQSVPVHATQVLQHIRQEAHQIAQESELQAAQMDAIANAVADNKNIQRQTQKVLSNFTGLKPMATAKVESAGPNDDKLSKLTRKLQDLILVAEQQGKREAQGGARLAEDSAQAIEEGRGEPKGLDESVSEELNLDQLYRDVLRSVEDAINLKRILRFDNDDHFDGGW